LKCLRHFHKKIPVLFRGDSTLLNEKPGLKKMLRRIFLKWVYSHVNIAFYAGSQNKLYFMKHGLKKDQLLFAPHAIDNERFFGHDGEYEKKAMAWRRELNIRDEDHVFLFAGKLEPVKNIELLIQSFLNIQSEPANAIGLQLIIVGNGILEKSLKEKYEKLQNIHFIGFQNQSQMPVVYRLGNVFVLPSKSETWGLSVNEAMACGRAILVSDKCGSAIDLVNENGFIFKSGNVDDLRLKMKWMAEMKAGIPKMGLNSENMIQDWNFEKLACVIEDKIMDPIH